MTDYFLSGGLTMNQTKKAFITAAFSLFTLLCAEAGTFSGKGAVK